MSNLFRKARKPGKQIEDSLKKIVEHFQRKGLNCYHGRIDRSTAEFRLLHDGRNENGLYLIRNASNSSGDYVLSYTSIDELSGKLGCKHLNILQVIVYGRMVSQYVYGKNTFFGLDDLLNRLKKNQIIKKPVNFQNFSKCLPLFTIGASLTTCLHSSIQSENYEEANSIIDHQEYRKRDLLILRDCDGESAIHLAAEAGSLSVVKKLVEAGALITLRNKSGYTPLHVAVKSKRLAVAEYLIERGADAFDRCLKAPYNSCLHDAAATGQMDMIDLLIKNNAPPWVFNVRKEIPSAVAERAGHQECAKYIENVQLPPASSQRDNWFHHNLTRQQCEEFFTKYDFEDGLFLIRPSTQPLFLSLSLCFNNLPHHFRIMAIEDKMYRIEPDGTTWPTLEHLVDHYSGRMDVLPCLLTTGISPINFKPIAVQCSMPKLRTLTANENTNEGSIGNHNSAYLETIIENRQATYITTANNHEDHETAHKVKTLLEIDKKMITLGHSLGNGEFGVVLKGTYSNDGKKKIDIAIKTLSNVGDNNQSSIDQFMREAHIMMNLDHCNIIKLIGICRDGTTTMMVQELAKYGSMLDYLLDHKDSINPKKELLLWAYQVACGMRYLEEQRFVHRDLAARNVLLANNKVAKVGDFGLSRAMSGGDNVYQSAEGGKWPIKWYALEAIIYGTFSSASDVWSYGVTLWEMFTFGSQPYGDLKGSALVEFIESNGRLKKPDKAPEEIYRVMSKCWSEEPEDRPTFEFLVTFFGNMDFVRSKLKKKS
ncbi:DgyrCDS10534 [Dimorphilus gyrociliatus]|uniref:Tyrosine-protein kinase n=1 Tax=Dimorphilus gyrociliatus TaxID=2664684 RepID=A0A7I8W321_9ANNE|nr:DgyrCDS10534 [Dimorphilus gyrociliatus]